HLPSWFPGTYYASFALASREIIQRLYDDPAEFVQKQMQRDGNVERSFISKKLTEIGDELDEEALRDIKGASATVFSAGMLFDVAREPIKRLLPWSVKTDSRNIAIEIPFLSWSAYFRKLCGIPHRSLNDDIYNGMLIPKGGMGHDKDVYSNPDAFDPTRFLPAPEGK
ncbi:hypothetical protein MPER_08000, partial [Moniliophthora perniciosa FA553]